jgi:hypothetical protein
LSATTNTSTKNKRKTTAAIAKTAAALSRNFEVSPTAA